MKLNALIVARTLVMLALFPALAGCATSGEPLTRPEGPVVAPADPVATEWASPAEAEIRPGSMIHTEARDCPVSYVFQRPDNGIVFLGTTAYCVRELVVGSLVTVGESGEHLAVLIYSSAITMAEIGERDPDALEYNDFAVFHLDSSSVGVVSPFLPGGGPAALADGDAFDVGSRVRAFSRTDALPRETDWREAIVSGRADEWALLTYAVLPGAPGALGGPVLDERGNAVGMLVTLGVLPNPGANGVARLDTMMAYARENAKLQMDLVTSTPPSKS